MLQDIDDTGWMLQPALRPALQAMVGHGLVFDALVQPRHLPSLLTLARSWPDLAIVIDHAAKPAIAQGQWEPWAADLQRLADESRVTCKLSGLLTEAGPAPAPDVATPWAAHVLACFGPARVLWGSDWPVLELAASYAQWWEATKQVLGGLTPAERAAVLGGNAREVYGL